MKLKNNILALVLSFGLLLTASGCSDSNRAPNDDLGGVPVGNSDNSTSTDSDQLAGGDDTTVTYYNHAGLLYNSNNEEIGSFNGASWISFVDSSILYIKANDDDPTDRVIEYWLYDIETKEDHRLGAIADGYSYFAKESLKRDGHLYIGISSGDYYHFENSTVTIYDIDLTEYSMTPLLEIKGGVPYDTFTVANGKLVVAELLYNGDTDLVEYDLSQKYDEPIVHEYDESDCFVHDSIRHIYADSENIYMVRLDCDDAKENYFLYLDKYDFDYNLLTSIDIREFCVASYFEDSEWDKTNEWKQTVPVFFVHNDLVYYENYSSTHALGTIEGDRINRLIETDSFFDSVYSVTQDEKQELFFWPFYYSESNKNTFYRVDPQTHEIETAKFYADDPDYYFRSARRDGDKILLVMEKKGAEKGRFYYIDINDLDFKPME